nr:MAG TPA: hypothetical protein [Caudoviricetes sp.]
MNNETNNTNQAQENNEAREAIREVLEKNVAIKAVLGTLVFFTIVAVIALLNGAVVALGLLPILAVLGLI